MLNQKILFVHEHKLLGVINDRHATAIATELDMKIGEIKHSVPDIAELNVATMLKQSVLAQIFDAEFLNEYIESQQPFEEHVYNAG